MDDKAQCHTFSSILIKKHLVVFLCPLYKASVEKSYEQSLAE
jgi:hypothetical protein